MSRESGLAEASFGKSSERQVKARLRGSRSEEFRWIFHIFLKSIHSIVDNCFPSWKDGISAFATAKGDNGKRSGAVSVCFT